MKVRSKYWLFVAAAWIPSLALAMASYVFILKPQVQRCKELDVQLADVKNLYRVARHAAEEENQLRLARAVDELNDRVSDFLVRPDATSDLAFELAKLANETGVESFSMKPKRKQGPEMISDCDLIGRERVELSFSGPFPEFATLLNALERHHPILFVETFAIHRPRTQTSEPQVTMELAVLVENAQKEAVKL